MLWWSNDLFGNVSSWLLARYEVRLVRWCLCCCLLLSLGAFLFPFQLLKETRRWEKKETRNLRTTADGKTRPNGVEQFWWPLTKEYLTLQGCIVISVYRRKNKKWQAFLSTLQKVVISGQSMTVGLMRHGRDTWKIWWRGENSERGRRDFVKNWTQQNSGAETWEVGNEKNSRKYFFRP